MCTNKQLSERKKNMQFSTTEMGKAFQLLKTSFEKTDIEKLDISASGDQVVISFQKKVDYKNGQVFVKIPAIVSQEGSVKINTADFVKLFMSLKNQTIFFKAEQKIININVDNDEYEFENDYEVTPYQYIALPPVNMTSTLEADDFLKNIESMRLTFPTSINKPINEVIFFEQNHEHRRLIATDCTHLSLATLPLKEDIDCKIQIPTYIIEALLRLVKKNKTAITIGYNEQSTTIKTLGIEFMFDNYDKREFLQYESFLTIPSAGMVRFPIENLIDALNKINSVYCKLEISINKTALLSMQNKVRVKTYTESTSNLEMTTALDRKFLLEVSEAFKKRKYTEIIVEFCENRLTRIYVEDKKITYIAMAADIETLEAKLERERRH